MISCFRYYSNPVYFRFISVFSKYPKFLFLQHLILEMGLMYNLSGPSKMLYGHGVSGWVPVGTFFLGSFLYKILRCLLRLRVIPNSRRQRLVNCICWSTFLTWKVLCCTYVVLHPYEYIFWDVKYSTIRRVHPSPR